MSHRHAQVTRRDIAEPAVVEALEKAGWEIHKKLPTDLLCIKRVAGELVVKLVEVKTPRGKNQRVQVYKTRQAKQISFLERHAINPARTPAEALKAVGEVVT